MGVKNIFYFIEGHLKRLGDDLNLIPEHQREQVVYRSNICKDDCMKYGYCIFCGCDVPEKMYNKISCNGGKRFPDMMTEDDWEKFKKSNNINLIKYDDSTSKP